MRAFVCEIDRHRLRRLVPEDQIPADERRRWARRCPPCPTTLAWALLAEEAAEELRADIEAGRHGVACGRLLNRAVELIGLGDAPCESPQRSC